MLYTFRILLDFEQDVFRDIQVNSDASFLELHTAIQSAFNFDNSQISSFYLSDNEWSKGDEISMMDMAGEQGEGTSYSMAETTIEKLVSEGEQKLVYVSDFFLMWCFFVELVKVEEGEITVPKVVLSYGDAPDQYSKEGDIQFESEGDLSLEEEESEEDIFEGFDDFDEYH